MVVCHGGRRPDTVFVAARCYLVILCVQGLVVGAVVYALENLTVTLHRIRLQGAVFVKWKANMGSYGEGKGSQFDSHDLGCVGK